MTEGNDGVGRGAVAATASRLENAQVVDGAATHDTRAADRQASISTPDEWPHASYEKAAKEESTKATIAVSGLAVILIVLLAALFLLPVSVDFTKILNQPGTALWAQAVIAIAVLLGSISTLGRMVNYQMKISTDLIEKALMVRLLESKLATSEKAQEAIITAVTTRLATPEFLVLPRFSGFFKRWAMR